MTAKKKIRRKLLAGHRNCAKAHDRERPRSPRATPSSRTSSPCAAATSPARIATNSTISRSPVPTEEMFRRIDRLGAFGTAIITISGGEPLLHPDLDAIIARIRKNGIIAGLITNGYLLTADRIQRLNRAGLEYLQISIDNVMPDEVSKKSLKVLDQKLKLLAEHADFHVNINSVLGSGVNNPEDALKVARSRRRVRLHVNRGHPSRRKRPTAASRPTGTRNF